MTEQEQVEAQTLAGMAGIQVPDERLPLLATRLQGNRRVAEQLSALDFGDTEPAARFRPTAGSGS